MFVRDCGMGFGLVLLASASLLAADPEKVDFSRDIRPILNNNCFACHGPDEAERKAKLRFDTAADAVAPAESGAPAIVPGKPDESELLTRITSTDPNEVMPPPATKKSLTDREKQLLRSWIASGAKYEQHWAFSVPVLPSLPDVRRQDWCRNEIDRFVLARLEREGLAPAPEADRATLIRRLSLDLTGLPPTPAEVDAFLADTTPQAYENVVDRLLSSIHYGERLAVDWLDAARFADTHGFHIDSGRDMTRWREWVIDAFHENMPFDQFTVEQLAGDLLPNPTLSQKIASGFNRNHMINFEGGAIPAEYHTAYIIDRVNTTATVWLGLTVACSQCHDHKYDPLSQKEFYQFYAFFNNVPENGLDGSKGNAVPLVRAPSSEQTRKQTEMKSRIAAIEKQLADPWPELDEAQGDWEQQALREDPPWQVPQLVAKKVSSAGGASIAIGEDGSVIASGENPATETYTVKFDVAGPQITAIRLELLPDTALAGGGPGRSVNGNVVLTNVEARYSSYDTADEAALKFGKASATFSQQSFPVGQAIDADEKTGWAIYPEVGRTQSAIFELDKPLSREDAVAMTLSFHFQSIYGQHQPGRFRVSLTSRTNPHEPTQFDAIQKLLAVPPDERTPEQALTIRNYYRTQATDAGQGLATELATLRKSLSDLEAAIPTAMVMQEMPTPRETFLLVRGQYDKPGDKVTAGVPAVLPPLPAGSPGNRLSLARWLVDPAHPLTARVTVNRYWQMLLGTGLVETSEDFGTQGAQPSHPDLLDWLACDFAKPQGMGHQPWDVRRLLRNIVTSSMYRQSSRITPELLHRDPDNRLLARGARFRLQAEFIRDLALSVSGLLDTRVGGASVSPYQPAGLWEELMSREDGANWSAQKYTQSHGPDLYRRTMYTFWKRTSPPAQLATFDAPDRETCTVRRARTNTPLQALILMNDPTYVESARKLAERVLRESEIAPEQRLALAFRLCVSRAPSERELAVLGRLLEKQRVRFRNDPQAARQVLSPGESPRDETIALEELAAWSTVCSVILQLDETLTKG